MGFDYHLYRLIEQFRDFSLMFNYGSDNCAAEKLRPWSPTGFVASWKTTKSPEIRQSAYRNTGIGIPKNTIRDQGINYGEL